MNIKKIILKEIDDFDWAREVESINNINEKGRVIIYMPKTYNETDKRGVIETLRLQDLSINKLFHNDKFKWEKLQTIHINDNKVNGWDTYLDHDEHHETYIKQGLTRAWTELSRAQVIYLK